MTALSSIAIMYIRRPFLSFFPSVQFTSINRTISAKKTLSQYSLLIQLSDQTAIGINSQITIRRNLRSTPYIWCEFCGEQYSRKEYPELHKKTEDQQETFKTLPTIKKPLQEVIPTQ